MTTTARVVRRVDSRAGVDVNAWFVGVISLLAAAWSAVGISHLLTQGLRLLDDLELDLDPGWGLLGR